MIANREADRIVGTTRWHCHTRGGRQIGFGQSDSQSAITKPVRGRLKIEAHLVYGILRWQAARAEFPQKHLRPDENKECTLGLLL